MADGYGHLPRGPKRLMMATRWSFQGLRAAWLHESSFRLEVVIALVMAALAATRLKRLEPAAGHHH